jgi:signal transduction histidine kinase
VKHYSLRNRLIGVLATGITAVWMAVSLASYRINTHEVDELLDIRLLEVARALSVLNVSGLEAVSTSLGPNNTLDDGDGDDDSGHSLAFQVWQRDGKLLVRTSNAPQVAFADRSGHGTVTADGQGWDSYAVWNESHSRQVRVFESSHGRVETERAMARQTILPLAVGFPILVLILWILLIRELRPLTALSEAVSARDSHNLTPITLTRVPEEVAPIVQSLNHFLARLGSAMDALRRFTADAAHELRTPIAGIKIHADLAAGAVEEKQLRSALDGVLEGANRTTEIVQRLLTLARADCDTSRELFQEVNLSALTRGVVDELEPLAREKNIALEITEDAPNTFVTGDPEALRNLIANIVDNAIRYTPTLGRVAVSVFRDGTAAVLTVEDNGPGIKLADRDRVFDRFYRACGNNVTGSGLGLAIVKEIADRHKARIVLGETSCGGGLMFNVRF